jgi:hypothetical protein
MSINSKTQSLFLMNPQYQINCKVTDRYASAYGSYSSGQNCAIFPISSTQQLN